MGRYVTAILAFTAIVVSSISLSPAQVRQEENIEGLHRDMKNYYLVLGNLPGQRVKEKEYISRFMDLTGERILAHYYTAGRSANERLVAEAQALLALAKFKVDDPTRAFHAIQAAERIYEGVMDMTVPQLGSEAPETYGKKIKALEDQWLRGLFWRVEAKVIGFRSWEKGSVSLSANFLHPKRRRPYEKGQAERALFWANDYLNQELRKGSKDITLLLPLAEYRLDAKYVEIFPTQFAVLERKEPVEFRITPNKFFSLEFRHDRYPSDTGMVTVSVPPKDLSVWHRNLLVDDFDTLEFGVYELRDSRKYKILDNKKTKLFLPEGEEEDWYIPHSELSRVDTILAKDRDIYPYSYIELRKYFREPPEPMPEAKKLNAIRLIIDVVAVGIVAGLFAAASS